MLTNWHPGFTAVIQNPCKYRHTHRTPDLQKQKCWPGCNLILVTRLFLSSASPCFGPLSSYTSSLCRTVLQTSGEGPKDGENQIMSWKVNKTCTATPQIWRCYADEGLESRSSSPQKNTLVFWGGKRPVVWDTLCSVVIYTELLNCIFLISLWPSFISICKLLPGPTLRLVFFFEGRTKSILVTAETSMLLLTTHTWVDRCSSPSTSQHSFYSAGVKGLWSDNVLTSDPPVEIF